MLAVAYAIIEGSELPTNDSARASTFTSVKLDILLPRMAHSSSSFLKIVRIEMIEMIEGLR
jgi:hypothetical protein